MLSELDLQLQKEKKGMIDNSGEIIGANGISKEASLNITLLEARNLPSGNFQGLSDPYAVLTLEGHKLNSAYKSNTLDPVWNENFSFTPTNKTSILFIEIWTKGSLYSRDSLLGKTQVFLESHLDQKKVLLNLEIDYNNNLNSKKTPTPGPNMILGNLENEVNTPEYIDNLENTSNATLVINLQFIWNKLKLYTDNYNMVERKIEFVKRHIDDLKQCSENLDKPFGLILYGDLNEIVNKNMLGEDHDYTVIVEDSKNKMKSLVSPRQTNTRYTFSNKLQNVIKSTFSKHLLLYIWHIISIKLKNYLLLLFCLMIILRNFICLFAVLIK